jgi:ceramide glucosyltransferase
MSSGPAVLRTLIEVWAGTNVGFTATLLVGVYRLARRPRPELQSTPAICILRPCEGDEPGLYENLLSSVEVAYPGRRRVLLLVPAPTDPAFAVASAVAAAASGQAQVAVSIVVTAPQPFENRKVAQLICGLAASDEPIVVCADSDVRLGGDDLLALVAALPGRGAAFAAPIEVAAQTGWDRASAALVGGSPQSFLALYGFHLLVGGAPSMAGALCAFARSALVAIGGLSGVRDCLGEDHELARKLCAAGYPVGLSQRPAACYDRGRGARAAIGRVGRWLTVVRGQRPALLVTYPLLLAATPALLLAALCLRSPVMLGFTAAVLLLRIGLCVALRRLQGLRRGPLAALGEVLLGEGLLWLGFLRAAGSRRIRWRGHPFVVERHGRLRPVD